MATSLGTGFLHRRFARSAQALQKTPCGRFWKINGDLSLNYVTGPFLSWIRQEYEELDGIIQNAVLKRKRIFIVLGTAGCGKSQFAVQFALKAAHNGRILFKKDKAVYIINGPQASSEGPFSMVDPQVQPLLEDPNTWLIVDGKQKEQIPGCCKVLLACSTRRTKYHEVAKQRGALKLYLSVWSREEVKQFMRDFRPYREEYASMGVPTKKRALEVFGSLGGCARYVLQEEKCKDGLREWHDAIHKLGISVDEAANVLARSFVDDVSDEIVHIFASTDHESCTRSFASDATVTSLHQEYFSGGMARTAAFLERTVSVSDVGPLWGRLYQSAVLRIFSAGPNRLPCKLSEEHSGESVAIQRRRVEGFRSLEQLRDLLASEGQEALVCYPENEGFESVDAAMLWNNVVVLLQTFKQKSGFRGVKVNGLEKIDAALAWASYEVWFCVPADYYFLTEPQAYTTVENTVYRAHSTVIPKITQRVVEVDYKAEQGRKQGSSRKERRIETPAEQDPEQEEGVAGQEAGQGKQKGKRSRKESRTETPAEQEPERVAGQGTQKGERSRKERRTETPAEQEEGVAGQGKQKGKRSRKKSRTETRAEQEPEQEDSGRGAEEKQHGRKQREHATARVARAA